jgi:uncharacterized protein
MKLRIAVILLLYAVPVLACLALGVLMMWQNPSLAWIGWLFPVCWTGAYVLTRSWRPPTPPEQLKTAPTAPHWTERDQAAWQLVEAGQQRIAALPAEQLSNATVYLQTAVDLAGQLAQHYHPRAKHPIDALTLVEVLAAAQLALEDSAQWVDQYIPGSHLLTVGQWKRLARVPAWVSALSNAAWAVRVVLQPTYLGQYVTTRWATSSATTQARDNALAWFFQAFVRYVGFYLIEMNSGRLRGGAGRYRDAMRALDGGRATVEPGRARPAKSGATAPPEVSIALIGQVNAGKSSLINALLGQQQAVMDVLPATSQVARFTLQLAESREKLTLLDTPGYGSSGASAAQRDEARAATAAADLVLLVMNVTNPARQADMAVLRELEAWWAEQPHLKRPAVVGVLTHADGLSPVREWSPPYDWTDPKGAKEQSMAAAAKAVQQEFGPLLAGVVPVCADVRRQRSYGIHEWLVPALLVLLDDARAAAILRNLHADLSRGQIESLFRQLGNAGWEVLKACFAGPRPS